MAAAGGEKEGVGDENVANPEPASLNRADDGEGPSEPLDVKAVRRSNLGLRGWEFSPPFPHFSPIFPLSHKSPKFRHFRHLLP